MTRLSVVIPVYHNAETLLELKERVSAASEAIPGEWEVEFIFVDDGSADASFQTLKDMAATDTRVRVARLSRNFGSNPAIFAGMTLASGDCVAVIAADLQDPPELLTEMAEAWQSGDEVILAARETREDPLLSKLPAMIFNRLFRRFVFKDFPPGGFDFMLLDRRAVDIIVRHGERNAYLFGQVMWIGFQRRIFTYQRQERQAGVSMWTFSRKVKYFIDAFACYSYLPLRFSSIMGILLALAGFAYAVVITILKLTHGFPVQGWASITIILLVVSGLQLFMLGTMGEYLWRVLEEVRKRPIFIIAEGINLPEEQ